ncbi:hypothetical protein P4639_22105 [Priestia megaterium]|uniref:hypothetical protein n=1 Tax=Priestia megaterium TaxID=1404 RepID=UPI002E1A60E7|nr:hypothetical protein [Priestia megaterium]
MGEKGKKRLKRILVGIGGIVILGAGMTLAYQIGNEESMVRISDKTYTYGEILEMTDDANAKLDSIKKEIKEQESKLDGKEKEVSEALEAVKKKDLIEEKNKKAEALLDKKGKELEALYDKVDEKNNELKNVSNDVVEAESAPIELTAGDYIIGDEIPAGRYKATNVGRGTNLIVTDPDTGIPSVNTILGDTEGIGRGDYVFNAEEGQKLNTRGAIKLFPQ